MSDTETELVMEEGPRLPPELLLEIMKHLKDSKRTLGRFMLANHQCFELGLPWLMETLELEGVFGVSLDKFALFFTRDPERMRFVRHLTLAQTGQNDLILQMIGAALPFVKSLDLYWESFVFFRRLWIAMTETDLQLERIQIQPNCGYERGDGAEFYEAFGRPLKNAPFLKRVTLAIFAWDDGHEQDMLDPYKELQSLDIFELQIPPGYGEWYSRSLKESPRLLRTLTCLRVHSDDALHQVSRYLKNDTLRCLELKFENYDNDFTDIWSPLSLLDNLVELRLVCLRKTKFLEGMDRLPASVQRVCIVTDFDLFEKQDPLPSELEAGSIKAFLARDPKPTVTIEHFEDHLAHVQAWHAMIPGMESKLWDCSGALGDEYY